MKFWIAILLGILSVNSMRAQFIEEESNHKHCALCFKGAHENENPYKELSWKNEKPFLIAGGISLLAAVTASKINNGPIPDASEILMLNPTDVNNFDRGAIFNNNITAKNTSDIIRTSVTFLPIIFLTNHNTREDIGTLLVLSSEVIMMTTGLTFLAKHAFRRKRPFLYNPDIDLSQKTSKTIDKSFFSGHTSYTASLSIMMAKVYTDYHPNMKPLVKVAVWSFSASLPLVTGYFRIKAGKHFPTDVITGYLVGGAIGWLVPQMHKSKLLNNKDFSLRFGTTDSGGFGLSLKF